MKIACISDTHNKHNYIDMRTLQDVDMIIHAGDFTSNGNQSQTISFLQWYESLNIEHKILVAGNHDFYCCSDTFQHLLTSIAPSVHYLFNSSVEIEGFKVFGSPYSNTFGHWAFMKDDLDLATIWEQIPLDSDIVITHGPAKFTGDKVTNPMYGHSPYVGSESLSIRLSELPNLKLHVTGHIHESAGIYLGKYTTINASICDLNYIPFNSPKVVNL